jgi:hypothetical protein
MAIVKTAISVTELLDMYRYLLTYVYHSLDFLPEEDLGFCGYLDDAYLAGRVAQHLQPDENWPLGGHLPDWLTLSRKAIPDVTTRLDSLFEDLLNGDTAAFHVAIVSNDT